MKKNFELAFWIVWIGSSIFPTELFAQVLSFQHHVPLVADSLWAYKLPFVESLDSGLNCNWDFSSIMVDNAESISLNYFAPMQKGANIGLHREHANYYYCAEQDTLCLSGFENSLLSVRYKSALPLLKFPFSYDDSLSGDLHGECQYCHLIPFRVNGTYSVRVDAIGRMSLPDFDIDSVVRVHTCLNYADETFSRTCVHGEIYSWYSSLCRYPVFETVRLLTISNGDSASFASSYYFPQDIQRQDLKRTSLHDSIGTEPIDSMITDVRFSPNPVYADLNIRYTLTRPASTSISIHYNGGSAMTQSPTLYKQAGEHSVFIDMSGFPNGVYVVYIHADEMIVSGNIIKL